MLKTTAHAKINLNLVIGARRPDGYHDLDSHMHLLEMGDSIELELIPGDELNIALKTTGDSCLQEQLPSPTTNLCYRAARLFADFFKLTGTIDIHLAKQIPIGAGLGGGSTDAAAVLRLLTKELLSQCPEIVDQTGLSDNLPALFQLIADQIAVKLGADVPFCYLANFARCRGVGDKVEPLDPLPTYPVLLVKPALSINTAEAYRGLDELHNSGERPGQPTELIRRARDFGRRHNQLPSELDNDFLPWILQHHPQLEELLTTLMNTRAIYVNMTGSGSTFFALYEDDDQLKTASEHLQSCSCCDTLGCKLYCTRLLNRRR